jgi:hypothetical protein
MRRHIRLPLLLSAITGAVHAGEIFRDDFNGSTLDSTKWSIGTWWLGRTQLGFTPTVSGGIAQLRLDKYNPSNPGGSFKGSEIWTKSQFSRGTNGLELEARVRVNALPDGLVTSFFTYAARTVGSNTLADEIDFEHISKAVNAAPAGSKPILLTTWNDYNVTGSNFGDPNVHNSSSVTTSGVDLQQFNTYRIRWLGNRVEWYLNGQFLLAKTQAVSTDPMNARINFWAPNTDWGDAYSSSFMPVNNSGANVSYFYDVDYVGIRDAYNPVTATATNRVFTDRFKNGGITNSDSITAFWTQRNSSGNITETTADPLKLTATGAGYPHAQIASAVRSEFNFFTAPLSITADGIDFRSTSGSNGKMILRFALSSQTLTADTQSEYTVEDAFSLRIQGDNGISLGYKLNQANANSEFDGVNLLNTSVSGAVRRFTLVVHPTFYKLSVEHETSSTDGTRVTDTFTGTLSLSLSEWRVLSGSATGNSAMFIQSQLNNSGAGENGVAMVDSLAVDAYRSTWTSTTGGSFSTAGNWSSEGVPNFMGANAVFGSSISGASTISLSSQATMGALKFDSANSYALTGGSILLDTPASLATIDAVSGSHQILSPITINKSLNVTVGAGATISLASLQGSQNVGKYGAGVLEVDQLNVNLLNIPQGTLRLKQGATPAARITSLDLAGTTLDVTNRGFVLDYSGVSMATSMRSQIKLAYANGAWSGVGIKSSLADASLYGVGYADSSSLLSVPAFFGSVDSTATLVRWTLFGDADLDGKVTTVDFNHLAGGFGSASGYWWQGDFNYNSIVDSTDFNLLIGNFGKSLPSAASLGAVVPEPAIGLGFAVSSLLFRRRHG